MTKIIDLSDLGLKNVEVHIDSNSTDLDIILKSNIPTSIKNRPGLAHFFEHLACKGLIPILAKYNGNVHAYTNRELVSFGAGVNTRQSKIYDITDDIFSDNFMLTYNKNISMIFDVISNNLINHNNITEEDVALEMGIINSERQQHSSKTNNLCINYLSKVMIENLFKSSVSDGVKQSFKKAYKYDIGVKDNHTIIGSEQDIMDVTREEIMECFNSMFRINNTRVILTIPEFIAKGHKIEDIITRVFGYCIDRYIVPIFERKYVEPNFKCLKNKKRDESVIKSIENKDNYTEVIINKEFIKNNFSSAIDSSVIAFIPFNHINGKSCSPLFIKDREYLVYNIMKDIVVANASRAAFLKIREKYKNVYSSYSVDPIEYLEIKNPDDIGINKFFYLNNKLFRSIMSDSSFFELNYGFNDYEGIMKTFNEEFNKYLKELTPETIIENFNTSRDYITDVITVSTQLLLHSVRLNKKEKEDSLPHMVSKHLQHVKDKSRGSIYMSHIDFKNELDDIVTNEEKLNRFKKICYCNIKTFIFNIEK